jgi:hypothetical protein
VAGCLLEGLFCAVSSRPHDFVFTASDDLLCLHRVAAAAVIMAHAAHGWRIHCGVEVTEWSTNKQHSLIRPSYFISLVLGPLKIPSYDDRWILFTEQFIYIWISWGGGISRLLLFLQ